MEVSSFTGMEQACKEKCIYKPSQLATSFCVMYNSDMLGKVSADWGDYPLLPSYQISTKHWSDAHST